mmetsp:Transcript_20033/g.55716  ORF Transcript_20033/g.55716 Transcript_20033/m.55716 type:complete len:90 (+) Transcript_20033:2-271(+)
MVCHQRDGFEPIPVCMGDGVQDWDYCVWPYLTGHGWDPINQLGLCEGDCDFDSDCQPGMVCHQRDERFDPIPGCIGDGHLDMDYCVWPT